MLNRGDGLTIQEVAAIAAAVGVVIHFVALVIPLLQLAHVLVAGAVILASGETVLGSTQSFNNQSLGSSLRLALLGHGFHSEGIHRLGDAQIAHVIAVSPVKGAFGLLCQVAQAGVEHAADHALSV